MTYTREQLEKAINWYNNLIYTADGSDYGRAASCIIEKALKDRLADMDNGWQPIETAPRDTIILMLPKIGLPFVGDIWARDCARRSDIEADELVRHMLPNGVIWNCEVNEIESWQPLPTRKD
jgi:hypothetical protein